jgi:hypothetical protein
VQGMQDQNWLNLVFDNVNIYLWAKITGPSL